jgi:hypothetical protein
MIANEFGRVPGLRQLTAIALLAAMPGAVRSDEQPPTREGLAFFESRIRPVLIDRCYGCHSAKAEEIEGGLALDTRAGLLKGGDSGPAIVPGLPDRSLLIKAIRHQDRGLEMPPRTEGGKLPDGVIADFERWVAMGAPDPRDGAATATPNRWDTSKAKEWWAFQPLRTTPAPTPVSADPGSLIPENSRAIDAWIDQSLQKANIRPNGSAKPMTLLRRLSFDLTGLPPTLEDADRFAREFEEARKLEGDPLDRVLPPLVDRLLKSPRYGEHFARRWLDVARYAESSGKDVNVTFPHAWRYRDYVIQAFQEDRPFDRFLIEQIAGDLIPARNDADRARQLIATGFLAVGAKSLNETNPRQFHVDLADEQIDAVTQATLGLTVACARCHDHKFDPISQRDYTSLAGIFLSTETRFGTPGGVQGRNAAGLLELPAGAKAVTVAKGISREELRRKTERLADLQTQRREALAQRAGGRTPTDGLTNFDVVRIITQATTLEAELSQYRADGSPKSLAMGVTDRPASAPKATAANTKAAKKRATPRRQTSGFDVIADSPLFVRGQLDGAADPVPRSVPGIVAPISNPVPPGSSGRRQLAEAIASPANPLTSRVIVNRVWSWLMGRGLGASVDNFGTTGAPPSHPELLDHLAIRFTREGWSIKRLIREITLTRAYRRSSSANEAAQLADPDNALVWRHAPRRLSGEEIRDAMLAAAGRLDLKAPAGSAVARLGDGPIGGDRRMAATEEQLVRHDADHRSIYLPLARSAAPEALATFDGPDASAPLGLRERTNVPAQALYLMNSDFVTRQAERLANRARGRSSASRVRAGNVEGEPVATDSDEDRIAAITRAFRLTFGREPDAEERAAALTLIGPSGDPAAWTRLCRGLYTAAEFRIVD